MRYFYARSDIEAALNGLLIGATITAFFMSIVAIHRTDQHTKNMNIAMDVMIKLIDEIDSIKMEKMPRQNLILDPPI
jgi:hypothetical protein